MLKIFAATIMTVVGLMFGYPWVAGLGLLWFAVLAHKAFPLGTRPPREPVPSTSEELRRMVERDLTRASHLLRRREGP